MTSHLLYELRGREKKVIGSNFENEVKKKFHSTNFSSTMLISKSES